MAEDCIRDYDYGVLTFMAKELHYVARGSGFYDDNYGLFATPVNIPEKLCLIHSEVSEALEVWRKKGNEYKFKDFAEELADVIIRTLDLCGYLNIDIGTAVKEKNEKNKTRPYKHGKEF